MSQRMQEYLGSELIVKQSAPVDGPLWDETAACFWVPTDINAYEIPDGLVWQEAFHATLTHHEPDFFTPKPTEFVLQELTNMPSDSLSENAIFLRNHVLPQVGKKSVMPYVSYEPPLAPTRTLAQKLSSPRTPTGKKPGLWGLQDSPMTPPLFRATSPRTRALRATHTKALLSMKQKPGVSAVIQGRELAFFRFGGEVFATNARCPHQGGNLCEGEVGDIEDLMKVDDKGRANKRTYVTCPVHKMQFDLRDGSVIDGNCKPLQTYRVRLTGMDHKRKFVSVEVGFNSLADNYFGELDC